jgi:hypothetical protein
MSPSSLSTTRSTIMHASLAYLSPQLQTFNFIIALHSRHGRSFNSKKSILHLPTELLFLIRHHLIAAMTAHLRARSASALKQYEYSLRSVLCEECISYNEDIFGADVWQWTHFSGPCGCSTSVRNANTLLKSPPPLPHHYHPVPFAPGIHQFTDPNQWLESYLSLEAIKLVGSPTLSGPGNPTTTPIWNLVHNILREFGCEVLRGCASDSPPSSPIRETHDIHLPGASSSSSSAAANGVLARWNHKSQRVLIVPLASALRRAEEAARVEDRVVFRSWRREVILRRVESELALAFEYPEDKQGAIAKTNFATSISRIVPGVGSHNNNSSSSLGGSNYSRHSKTTINGAALVKKCVAVFSACASFPNTLVISLLILFCYYRRLGTLRNF